MSLNRADVIRQYQQLCVAMDLPPKQVVLSAGAAMVMLGLRKTTADLDVDVPKDFFEKHKARKGARETIVGEVVAWDGLVDIHTLPSDVEIVHVNDVWIYCPKDLIAQKELLANHTSRPPEKAAQDKKDLSILKASWVTVTPSKDTASSSKVKDLYAS